MDLAVYEELDQIGEPQTFAYQSEDPKSRQTLGDQMEPAASSSPTEEMASCSASCTAGSEDMSPQSVSHPPAKRSRTSITPKGDTKHATGSAQNLIESWNQLKSGVETAHLSETTRLQVDLTTAQEKLDIMIADNDAMERELKATRKATRDAERKLDQATHGRDEAESDLAIVSESFEDAKHEYSELQDDYEELQDGFAEKKAKYKRTIARHKEDLDASYADQDQKDRKIVELERRLEVAQDEGANEVKDDRIAILQRKNTDMEDTCKRLSDENGALRKQAEEMKRKNEALRNGLGNVETAVQSIKTKVSAMK